MDSPTVQSELVDPAARGAFGHPGSAAMALTGWTVLIVWICSVALHVAGLVGMFLLVFPFGPREEPAAAVTHVELVGGLKASPFAASPAPDLTSRQVPVDPADVRFTPKEFERLSELTGSTKPGLTIIGIGTGGGDFSRYGLTAARGEAPDFFGLGGSAQGVRRVIYVVDRSGSMLATFAYVGEELRRSILALRRSQKFHVIFFNSGEPLEAPPRRPVSAIEAAKAAFFKFLTTVNPEGSTDPGPAMRRALADEPDVIYFLTDGEFDRSLIAKLDRWNRDRRVKIFTIAYFDQAGAALLEEIAREHGGEFKFVTEDDLP